MYLMNCSNTKTLVIFCLNVLYITPCHIGLHCLYLVEAVLLTLQNHPCTVTDLTSIAKWLSFLN